MCDTMGHLLIFLCLTAVVTVKSMEDDLVRVYDCMNKHNVTIEGISKFDKNNPSNEACCVAGCVAQMMNFSENKEKAVEKFSSDLNDDQKKKLKTCYYGIDSTEDYDLGTKLMHCDHEFGQNQVEKEMK